MEEMQSFDAYQNNHLSLRNENLPQWKIPTITLLNNN